MTYEKFEHKVLGMLLEGDDPRLEKLIAQTWDMEVLSRDETEMGFTVKFLAPTLLTINEPEGRIFGVEVKLTESETVTLELIIKDGLIERLKGVFTADMTYSTLIKRFNELTFAYKNGMSSELNFHSDNRDPDEVTFVKNIATISKEIDAHISKAVPAESDAQPRLVSAREDEMPAIEVPLSEEAPSESEPLLDDLIEEPFQFEKDQVEVPAILATETQEDALTEEEVEKEEEVEENLDEEVLVEEPFSLEIDEVHETDEADEMDDMSEEEVGHDPAASEMEENLPALEKSDLMMPPSFSIPKVPDAIRKRWVEEVIPYKSFHEAEIPKTEDVRPSLKQVEPEKKVTTVENVDLSDFDNVLDGKAPQGPVSFSDELITKESQKESGEKGLKSPSLGENEEDVEDELEFKNLTPRELSDPNLEIKNPVDIDPEELESAALSAVDDEEVERSIALMQKRTREIRVLTCLIVLVTLILLYVLISTFLP